MPHPSAPRARVAATAAVLLGATLLSAQQVIVVDGTDGPGTDFTDLPTAVAESQDGDIIAVRPGLYRPFSTSKGIKVLCDPNTRIENPAVPNELSVTVSGLPAGKLFVLRGVSLGSLFMEGTRMRIENCQGRVVIEDIVAHERGATLPACEIVGSSDVRLHRGTLIGRNAIRAEDSTLTITDSALTGVHHPLSAVGSEALAIERCTAVVSRTRMEGGRATFFGLLLPPAAGVLSTDSELTITGDDQTSVAAGDGASLQDDTPVPAIIGSGGRLRIHPAIQLTSNGGAPGIATTLPTSFVKSPSVSASGADLGETLDVELFARPGAAFLVAAGLSGPPTSVPGLGLLALDARAIVVGIAGIVPVDRRVPISIDVPAQLDVLFGVTFTWQAIDVASGSALLGNPVTYTHGR